MAKNLLIVRKNLAHKNLAPVAKRIAGAGGSLRELAEEYMRTQVAGQARGTVELKARALKTFLQFYLTVYNHDDPAEWYKSLTEEFIKQLKNGKLIQGREGGRPTVGTVRTHYAHIRSFARWVNDVHPFPLGCPTDGVREPEEEDPEWKGLSAKDELRLRNAAQTLRVAPGRGRDNSIRDEAILETLLGSGLRVSEVVGLEVSQFDGKCFTRVVQKGNRERKKVYLDTRARASILAWLKERGRDPGPLFTTANRAALTRWQVNKILSRICRQANARVPAGEEIHLTPHTLRHTFLRKVAEKHGVQYAKQASGHRTDRYIWRYVQPSDDALGEAVANLSE